MKTGEEVLGLLGSGQASLRLPIEPVRFDLLQAPGSLLLHNRHEYIVREKERDTHTKRKGVEIKGGSLHNRYQI